jgi:ribonuclease E
MTDKKTMLVNALDLEEVRVAILREEARRARATGTEYVLDQIYFQTRSRGPVAGSIYKGRVANFEKSLDAAFVDLGSGKHGFLHMSDVALDVGIPGTRRPDPEATGRDTDIREYLSSGRELVVQVRKEGVGEKGPSLTSFLGLPGRYLVLMPALNRIGVSKRITDRTLREELKHMLADLGPLEGLGFVIRTEARGVSAAEIRRDADALLARWHTIIDKSRTTPAPTLLWAEADLVERAVRDYLTADTAEIWVDSPDAFMRVRDYLTHNAPALVASCHLHEGSEPLFHRYGVEDQMRALLDHEVKLPGGGGLVIEQTEAMVVVDVNSGKSRHRAGNASMILQTNLEAAREAARQLRLRDLGGLVVIDFIDMETAEDRANVENEMRAAIAPDKARTTVLPISDLGILEMTRQRRGETFEKRVSERCPHCRGRGFVRSVEAVSLAFARDLRAKIRSVIDARPAAGGAQCKIVVVARFGPTRALAVANRLRAELGRLELANVATVEIEADDTLGPDQFAMEVSERALDAPPRGAASRAAPVEPRAGVPAEPDAAGAVEAGAEASVPTSAPTAGAGAQAADIAGAGGASEGKPRRRRRRSRRRRSKPPTPQIT